MGKMELPVQTFACMISNACECKTLLYFELITITGQASVLSNASLPVRTACFTFYT